MSPFNEEPSCRCLSPRVLSRSRYDAHWLRQASDVQNTLEALTTTARSRFPMNDAILFQTSVDCKACPAAVTRLGSWDLPGFCSLSAPSSPDETTRDFRSRRSPLTGFHNLSAGLSSRMTRGFIPPRRHSWGYGLQSLTPKRSDILVGLLAPASLSLPHGFLPVFRWVSLCPCPRRISRTCGLPDTGP